MTDYFDNYCLTVNLKKAKIIVFCNKKKTHQVQSNRVIEQETSHTYLGIVFISPCSVWMLKIQNCQVDLY